MANFSINGLDQIEASFEELASLSEEEKFSIIMPAAEFLKDRHSEKLRTAFNQFTGVLAKSLKIFKKTTDDGVTATIIPTGKHPNGKTGKRMKLINGRRRSSGKYSGSNAEIAYILEYGSPRIKATHWMENANEESQEEVFDIQEKAWDNLLKEKGL